PGTLQPPSCTILPPGEDESYRIELTMRMGGKITPAIIALMNASMLPMRRNIGAGPLYPHQRRLPGGRRDISQEPLSSGALRAHAARVGPLRPAFLSLTESGEA